MYFELVIVFEPFTMQPFTFYNAIMYEGENWSLQGNKVESDEWFGGEGVVGGCVEGKKERYQLGWTVK